jgi:hypothetical protein
MGGGVFARRTAEHGAKVVDEVRLVVPAEPDRELGEVHAGRRLDLERSPLCDATARSVESASVHNSLVWQRIRSPFRSLRRIQAMSGAPAVVSAQGPPTAPGPATSLNEIVHNPNLIAQSETAVVNPKDAIQTPAVPGGVDRQLIYHVLLPQSMLPVHGFGCATNCATMATDRA